MRLNGTWHDRLTQEVLDEFTTHPRPASPSARAGSKQDLWNIFMQRPDLILAPPPRKNPQTINVDWPKVLLGHARLYCFADKYGIVPLQELCLNAVRAALIDLACEGDQFDALVQMICYTLEHTSPTNHSDTHNLRAVVLDYTVIVFEVLIRNERFREFLHSNNDTSVDLLSRLSARLG